jgi:hypothetical protein
VKKRRDLKLTTLKDSLRVLQKERVKKGLNMDVQAILTHPTMLTYLEGK